MHMTVRAAQRILADEGFFGMDRAAAQREIDGIMGPRTREAIRTFQRNADFPRITGQLDPATVGALRLLRDGAPGPFQETVPWLEVATGLIGTREISGRRSNNEILSWACNLNLDYANDDTPWCGLFVAHCIGRTLPDEALPSNPLGARRWMKFGEAIEKPKMGAVVVFWRHHPNDWRGHVGFYFGEDDDHILCLGGNQSNAVNVRRIPKSRVLGYRWPNSVSTFDFPPSFNTVTGRMGEVIPFTTGEQ